MARQYDVVRLEVDVRYAGGRSVESKEETLKIFFDFCKVFQRHLVKYASSTLSVPSTGTAYGNIISFKKILSQDTINKTIRKVEDNSKFAVKKTEYYSDSKLMKIIIERLD